MVQKAVETLAKLTLQRANSKCKLIFKHIVNFDLSLEPAIKNKTSENNGLWEIARDE